MKSVKGYIAEWIADSKKRYVQDLKALPADRLSFSPGGTARSAYDFTYELVSVNERIAARLRGESVQPPTPGWVKAPPEFCSPETAVRGVEESTDAILALWNNLSDADMEREIPMGSGTMTFLLAGAMCGRHINYHDAQLNYLQAMGGDDAVHWD